MVSVDTLSRDTVPLMELKPDLPRGCRLRLVNATLKPFMCIVDGCVAKFAERRWKSSS
jgi:hypothetical protein